MLAIPFYEDEKITLWNGDCRDAMKTFPENSIDSVVCDPPYGLEFMGKEWDSIGCGQTSKPGIGDRRWSQMQAWHESWASEVLRVLKHGGHLLAFGGSRTYHRLACAIEDTGFEIRDQIMWIYGSGFPKSLDVSKSGALTTSTDFAKCWAGFGTALKPAHESIVVARKPLIGTVIANVEKYGTGALNIDACRVEYRQSGRYDATTDLKKSGRWPANVIHDGSDEVVELFPQTRSGIGAVKKLSGTGYLPNAYCKESRAVGTPNIEYGDTGSAVRFFYCAKTSKKERGEGNKHPTVKPLALMRYLCRLVTRSGGLVMDPFAGSGTTLLACMDEGFKCIGIEQSEEYCNIILNRIADKRVSE